MTFWATAMLYSCRSGQASVCRANPTWRSSSTVGENGSHRRWVCPSRYSQLTKHSTSIRAYQRPLTCLSPEPSDATRRSKPVRISGTCHARLDDRLLLHAAVMLSLTEQSTINQAAVCEDLFDRDGEIIEAWLSSAGIFQALPVTQS